MTTAKTGVLTPDQQRAFEAEALPHLDMLYRFGLHLTGVATQAEDLVQETMLRAWRGWGRFESGTNVRAWLMTILRHLFINQYRKDRRRPAEVDLDDVDPTSVFEAVGGVDPEGHFFSQITDERVLRAIEDLPPDYRATLLLSDGEGLSYAEIAQVLEVPIGTVRSRLFRARRRLQTVLHDYAVEAGYLRAASPSDEGSV